jgi:hypothetical protein
MITIERHDEYRVSERVVLRPGDVFRATGGPYWRSGKDEISLKAPGPYRFVSFAKRGAVGWIEAFDKFGNFTVLHIEGRRKKIDTAIVARPYRVIGKKRPQLQRLDNRKKGR